MADGGEGGSHAAAGEQQQQQQERRQRHLNSDMMRILLATDCHLGYAERDPIRGQDSLRTFEEILQLANKEEVDLILLGGDLFHENKPSRETLMRTMELFRRYCMGSRPCAVQIVSDQRINFPRFGAANYMDPNYNVGMAVFSIHGNHDDPSGEQSLCALDLLAAANFVNYFGQSPQPDDIEIVPVCLQKGHTKLALYGLGNIRDERLHRTFLKKKVKWLAPDEAPDDWFNLLIIHQNRVKHGERNYIPENFLPDFIHLTFWGHEHKCEIDPMPREVSNTYITQPGSSVATSLSEGESVYKHVGILHLRADKAFKISKVPLKTVRPFKFRDLVLADHLPAGANEKDVEEFLATEVQALLRALESEHRKRFKDDAEARKQMRLPLLRLRVEYTGYPTLGAQRFGQRFAKQVANPKDILLFYRKRTPKPRATNAPQAASTPAPPDPLDQDKIEDLVERSILQCENPPRLIKPKKFRDALSLFVDKEENEALKSLATYRLERYVDKQLASAGADMDASKDEGEEGDAADAVVIGDDDAEAEERRAMGEEEEEEEEQEEEGDGYGDDDGHTEPRRQRASRNAAPLGSRVAASDRERRKGSKKRSAATAAASSRGSGSARAHSRAVTTTGGGGSRRGGQMQLSFESAKRGSSSAARKQSRSSKVLSKTLGGRPKARNGRVGAGSRKPRGRGARGVEYDEHDDDEEEEEDYNHGGGDADSDVVTSDGEVLTNYTTVSEVTDMTPSVSRRSGRRAASKARARTKKMTDEAQQSSSDEDDYDHDDAEDVAFDYTRRSQKRPKRR